MSDRPELITRRTTDANFEHVAKTLIPFAVEALRDLEPGDVIDWNTLHMIHLCAETALAFSHERYGKPRFRAPARTRLETKQPE